MLTRFYLQPISAGEVSIQVMCALPQKDMQALLLIKADLAIAQQKATQDAWYGTMPQGDQLDLNVLE